MIDHISSPKTAAETDVLRVISIQSVNADESCQQITAYLGQQLGLKTEFVVDKTWQEREAMLDSGQAHIGWVCGLPYVWKADRTPGKFALVAAPVMADQRYQQQPVYFSDVIVRAESNLKSFADLRGKRWAYNEPHSQSGYNITRYHLAKIGEANSYFGAVLDAGAHLTAIEMVLNNEIDASAIDSTVLELAYEADPTLKTQLRIIDTLGPSPIPPWIVSRKLSPDVREAIRCAFLQMHQTPAGRAILRDSQMLKMAAVTDADYDPIRHMAQLADQVTW